MPKVEFRSYNPTTNELRETWHPVEVCEMRPPQGGPMKNPSQIKVRVVREIQTGDKMYAQVVLVRAMQALQNGSIDVKRGALYIVKLHDPMYANNDESFTDPHLWTDLNYAREAAVYNHAPLKSLQGDLIPKFQGSYTTKITVQLTRAMIGNAPPPANGPARKLPREVPREVRCIMTEYNNGTVMSAISTKLAPNVSKALIKAVLDAEARMLERGVEVHDYAPRNLIISQRGNTFGVMIVDLADADLTWKPCTGAYQLFKAHKLINPYDGCYVSPKWTWHSNNLRDNTTPFHGWVTWNTPWQEWLNDTYRNDYPTLTPDVQKQLESFFVI